MTFCAHIWPDPQGFWFNHPQEGGQDGDAGEGEEEKKVKEHVDREQMQVDFMDADDMALFPEEEREQWIPELEPRRGWRGGLWARRPESQALRVG